MIEKVINGGNYQPTLTDKIVLDSTPTVNSLNGVTSDAVARAVAGASGEVPAVTENDNGKVLTAIYDEGGPAVEWASVPAELPDSTGASEGDVLTVGSSGLEWAPAQGGSGDSATVEVTTSSTAADVTAILSSGKIPYMTYNNTRLWYSGTQWSGMTGTVPVFTGFASIADAGVTSLTVYAYTIGLSGWYLTTKTISFG